MKFLIDKCANDNEREDLLEHKSLYGYSALFLSSQLGNVNQMYLLLMRGANIDTTDNNGDTPLYWILLNENIASANAHVDGYSPLDPLRLLLAHKTNVLHLNNNKVTAMHILCTQFKSNKRVLELARVIYLTAKKQCQSTEFLFNLKGGDLDETVLEVSNQYQHCLLFDLFSLNTKYIRWQREMNRKV